ncbi:MFS general substrate transporter [Irpex rosettiformis]|uniref:MFS general substrate transporter n=1 Tax=Irpex rosettiformis TaxID=378272 RepID=A0ACB8TTV9_9APHY|nr:MFS general substrate transporter [Irpex rosettiformis]
MASKDTKALRDDAPRLKSQQQSVSVDATPLDAQVIQEYDNGHDKYTGRGTREDPFVVDWDDHDSENPFNWTKGRRWLITIQLALGTWTVSFCSSSYTGGLASMMQELHMSREVAILGVSLYVLGFGIGPLVFAPASELYGRRIVFLSTYSVFTLMHLGGALGHNTATMLSTRFLAGIFGSSPLTNASGVLSDMWTPKDRALVSSIYATAPFMGPVLGPIVSGWIAETRLGWRFNFWLMLIFSAVSLLFGFIATPETFAPVLLRRRAKKLTESTENRLHYLSQYDLKQHSSFLEVLRINLRRPFVFLLSEPIVLLLSIYISIVYAILYAFFAAFPIVFQQIRGFSSGQGGLAFLGVGLGVALGTALAPLQNKLYREAMRNSPTGRAPPEARLYLPMMGAIVCPAGLFWFAWTSLPPIHWIVPILAGIPFGIGVAQIMTGLTQYLMDCYTIYCASAIASTVILRSILAAIFPLISPAMYKNLGVHWASSVFAFLSVLCMPMPFLFFKYGPWIRSKSNFAQNQQHPGTVQSPSPEETLHEKSEGTKDALEKV